MKHLLSLQRKHIGRKDGGRRRRVTALLLCLCLICSNLVSAVYAAGMDSSSISRTMGSGLLGSAGNGTSGQAGLSENDENKDGSSQDKDAAGSQVQKDDTADTGDNADAGAAGSQTQKGDTAVKGDGSTAGSQDADSQTQKDGAADKKDTDSAGAGTVVVGENAGNKDSAPEMTGASAYKLYITHVLAVDGYLFADEDVEVNVPESALAGSYNVLQNIYTRAGMEVTTKELTVTKSDFQDGACYAKIDYKVADGYKARYTLPTVMARSIYVGKINDVWLEQVAKTVEVTLKYQFHKSTGMNGVPAHSYDQVVQTPVNNVYILKQSVPDVRQNSQLENLIPVLNPKPLEELEEKLKNDGAITEEERRAAFESANTITKTGTANGGNVRVTYTYYAGEGERGEGEIRATIPGDAAYTHEKDFLTLDVFYYRWEPTTYAVEYRDRNNNEIRIHEEVLGHEGALTAVKGSKYDLSTITTEDGTVYIARGFSEQKIEKPEGNRTEPKTKVVIYYDVYVQNASYQLIFDTDGGTAIDRVTKKYGDTYNLPSGAAAPTRQGYDFVGWKYMPKGGEEAPKLLDDHVQGYIPATSTITLMGMKVDGVSSTAAPTPNQCFLDAVEIEKEGTGSNVNVIRFTAEWRPQATAKIRVEFWTEALGFQDAKITETNTAVLEHREPEKVENGKVSTAGFEYVGSAPLDVSASAPLIESGTGSGAYKLCGGYQGQMEDYFATIMKEDAAHYRYKTLRATRLNGNKEPSLDGTTVVYMFFSRREYKLAFQYLLPPAEGDAMSTPPGETPTPPGTTPTAPRMRLSNGDTRTIQSSGSNLNNLRTKWIVAKYGADLSDVWPSPEQEKNTITDGGSTYKVVAWYMDVRNREKKITDKYAAMGTELIDNPNTVQVSKTLTACWAVDSTIKTYRYNYFLEAPDLDPDTVRSASEIAYNMAKGVKIGKDIAVSMERTGQSSRVLYYVSPKVFTTDPVAYDHGDYLRANGLAQTAEDLKDRNGYLVKIHREGEGAEKCYVLFDRVMVKDDKAGTEQAASDRQHMNPLSSKAHVAQVKTSDNDNLGMNKADGLMQNGDDFTECIFYYDRVGNRITYLVNDQELGYMILPYGAMVSELKYGFRTENGEYTIDCTKKNDEYAARGTATRSRFWSIAKDGGNRPVCPDRYAGETKAWKFDGWTSAPDADDAPLGRTEAKPLKSDLRVYAKWTPDTYKVSFDLNGGTLLTSQSKSRSSQIEEQTLRGGQTIAGQGQVPQPVRVGYDLTNWLVTSIEVPGATYTYDRYMKGYYNDDGQKYDTRRLSGNPQYVNGALVFDFNMGIFADMTVEAQWNVNQELYGDSTGYTVHYYVLDGYDNNHNPIAKTKSSGQPVRVADDKVVTDIPARGSGDTVVYELPVKPKPGAYENYSATSQNYMLTLAADETQNTITFYYAENKEKSYTVRYVNYRKQSEVLQKNDPVKGFYTNAVTVYPDKEVARRLGCRLVDKNGNNVESEQDLGITAELADDAGQNVFTFYLDPIRYKITYEGLNFYYASGNDDLGNPTGYYSIYHTGMLTPPKSQFVGLDGTTYVFQGWKMGLNTNQESGRDYPSYDSEEPRKEVTIAKGTMGDLVFEAVWDKILPAGLRINKVVDGDEVEARDREQGFTFVVKVSSDVPLTGAVNDTYEFYCESTNIVDDVTPPRYTKIGFKREQDGSAGDGNYVYSTDFNLRHGQSLIIYGLPAQDKNRDVSYVVTEVDANKEPFQMVPDGATSGPLKPDQVEEIIFSNNHGAVATPGSLSLSKNVTGSDGDLTKGFTFRIQLTEPENGFILNRYKYTGDRSGVLALKDGVGEFELCHGEKIDINKLPAGASYTITESDNEGYIVDKKGDTGTIAAGMKSTAAYINHRGVVGPDVVNDLYIGKTLTGSAGDATSDFHFTVTLTNAEGNRLTDVFSYDGSKSGTMRSGTVISLRGGEGVTIRNLPAGTGYLVTEAEANQDGYSTSSTGESGIISNMEGDSARAVFNNYRETDPNNPDDPNKPGDPTPTNPDDPNKPGNQTPTNPDDPNKPGNSTPTNPDDPNNPNNPDDPNNPNNPDDPNNPNNPNDPNNPNNPNNPNDPNNPNNTSPTEPGGSGGNGNGDGSGNGSSGSGGTARTGDAGHLTQWLALLELSLGGFLILLIIYLVRRNRRLG